MKITDKIHAAIAGPARLLAAAKFSNQSDEWRASRTKYHLLIGKIRCVRCGVDLACHKVQTLRRNKKFWIEMLFQHLLLGTSIQRG